MSKKRTYILITSIAVVVVIILCAVFALVRPFPQTIRFNRTMYGTLITSYDRTDGPVEFELKCTIKDYEDEYDRLTLECIFPTDFPYLINSAEPHSISYDQQKFNLPYYGCSGFIYNKFMNQPQVGCYAVDPEKEYFIAKCDDTSGEYLVASTDPDTDPQAILEYFRDFCDLYAFN